MVNFGLLAAEIVSLVWGTPANFNRLSSLGSVTARQSSSDRQPNFAALIVPMPNVMVALPNIGGALCSTPQSVADDHYLTAVQ